MGPIARTFINMETYWRRFAMVVYPKDFIGLFSRYVMRASHDQPLWVRSARSLNWKAAVRREFLISDSSRLNSGPS